MDCNIAPSAAAADGSEVTDGAEGGSVDHQGAIKVLLLLLLHLLLLLLHW